MRSCTAVKVVGKGKRGSGGERSRVIEAAGGKHEEREVALPKCSHRWNQSRYSYLTAG